MNYYYIEYMTKERRREEMHEYKRRQLLANSGSKKPMTIIILLEKLFRKVWFVGKTNSKVTLLNIFAIKAKG